MNVNLSKYKEIGVTFAVIFLCTALYVFFPTDNVLQLIILTVMLLVVVPALYVKFILNRSLLETGLTIGDWKKGVLLASTFLLSLLVIVLLLLKFSSLKEQYTIPLVVQNSFLVFVMYELFVVGLIALSFEYFFRGFMVCGLRRKLGLWAVLVQLIILELFFVEFTDLSDIQITLVAPFAGIIAYYSRSIYYSLAFSFVSAVIIDALVISANR